LCQPSGTRDLYLAAPGWAACRVRSRKGYRQAAWNEASRGSDGGGADTASDRDGRRIRSRHVGYFDAITNNYRSSTAGNHRISGLGSNSPNTPNGLSPYLLPIKEQAAPCVRPCPAPLPPALAGACLRVGADLTGRVLVDSEQIDVGIITPFIGAPFFVWIVRRQKVREL